MCSGVGSKSWSSVEDSCAADPGSTSRALGWQVYLPVVGQDLDAVVRLALALDDVLDSAPLRSRLFIDVASRKGNDDPATGQEATRRVSVLRFSIRHYAIPSPASTGLGVSVSRSSSSLDSASGHVLLPR